MLKKSLALLLTVAVTASLAVGCTPKKTEPASGDKTPAPTTTSEYGDTGGLKLPLVDKPTTLTWMLVSSVQGLNDKLVIKEIEKRTGIKLDIQAVPAQSYPEKAKITIASGKLPDIMHGQPVSELNTLGAQGAIAPINKYLDKLPNFKKLYVDNAENNWVMKSWTDDKGNLYSWPVYGVSRDVNHGFLYRKDILDKNGIKEWTNTEEFYQALKKLKEIYPNSTPYVSKTQAGIFKDWSYGWGIGGNSYPSAYDEKAKEWKLATTSKEFKDMLDFMKKLYNEGLLDPEFVTDTQASWTAKMTQNDKAFVSYDWIGRLDMFRDQVKSQIPDYNLRYANPVGPTGNIRTLNKVQSFGIMVANNEKQETALKLLDYLSSPSGAELITMGVKGVSYDVDSAGKITYPELKDVPKIEITTLENKYGCWLEGMYVKTDTRSAYFNYTEKEQEAQDKINKAKKYEPIDPVLKFTNDENAQLAEILTSLQKEADAFSTKYIVTKSQGDKEWNEWLEKADKLGAKKYVDIYNAAQKRYESAK